MATGTDSRPAGGEKNGAESAVLPHATNAIEAAGRRKGSSRTERETDAGVEPGSAQRNPENSIQLTRRRAKASDPSTRPKHHREARRDPGDRAAAPEQNRRQGRQDARTSPEGHRLVPDHVQKRFVRVGKHYYFADGARAFTDRGGRLTTPSENTEVIRSLVVIAEARGWSEITVRGTERFRKEAWFAARLAGLEVRGFRPTEFEQAHLVRTLSRDGRGADQGTGGEALSGLERREQSEGDRGSRSRNGADSGRQGRQGALLAGKLVDHGRATYRHDPREPMSYFVKIE